FFECWDSYLSAALYSENTPEASLYVDQAVYDELPQEARRHVDYVSNPPDAACPYEVAFFEWAYEEMNVPPYPAPRSFRDLARRLAGLPHGPADGPVQPALRVVLILRGRPDWRTGKRVETREEFRR